MPLTIGMRGYAEAVVTEQNIASSLGNDSMPVFATPYLIALMEQAAMNAIQSALESGEGSVGSLLHVTHDAATPIGYRVWSEAVLNAVEGRKLTFTVKAFDEHGPIGSGIHERFIVQVDRFIAKITAKGRT